MIIGSFLICLVSISVWLITCKRECERMWERCALSVMKFVLSGERHSFWVGGCPIGGVKLNLKRSGSGIIAENLRFRKKNGGRLRTRKRYELLNLRKKFWRIVLG